MTKNIRGTDCAAARKRLRCLLAGDIASGNECPLARRIVDLLLTDLRLGAKTEMHIIDH